MSSCIVLIELLSIHHRKIYVVSLVFLVPPGEKGLNVAKIQNHKTITALNETSRNLVHNYALLTILVIQKFIIQKCIITPMLNSRQKLAKKVSYTLGQ